MGYPSYLVHFNKNHDKLGRFSFGDGNGDGRGNDHSRRDGEGSSDPKSPDSYRTSELDKKYSEAEKTGLFKLQDTFPWLKPGDDAEKLWGKDIVKAVDVGIEAMRNKSFWDDPGDFDDNDVRSWFFLDDMAPGFAEISYLATKGWDKNQISSFIKDANDMHNKNSEFYNAYTGYPKNKNWSKKSQEANDKEPYKGIYNIAETAMQKSFNGDPIDAYIDECVKLAKDMEHSDMADYLIHFNKNHDKLGRFAIGDGDGDGTRDDHHNQDKETAGQKIKRAVDTYDSVRSDIRRRNLEDEEYKVKKGNLNLRQDQIANQRNQEQTDVKSRNIDLSLQKQDARLQKLQMKNAMREERARAFIEKYRMQQELRAEKQAERAAKAQDKAAKNYERDMKRAERNAVRERRQQQRAYERSVKQQQRAIDRYNSAASRQRTKAFISLATGNLIGAGLHAYNASKYTNRANSYQ